MVWEQTALFALRGVTTVSQLSCAMDKPAPSGTLLLLHVCPARYFYMRFDRTSSHCLLPLHSNEFTVHFSSVVGLAGEWILGHHAQPAVEVGPRPGVSAAWRVPTADRERWRASAASAQGGDPLTTGSAAFCPVPDGPLPTGDRWVYLHWPQAHLKKCTWTLSRLLICPKILVSSFEVVFQLQNNWHFWAFVCFICFKGGKHPANPSLSIWSPIFAVITKITVFLC